MVFQHLSAVLMMALACTTIIPIVHAADAPNDAIIDVQTNFDSTGKCLYHLCKVAVQDTTKRITNLTPDPQKWSTTIDPPTSAPKVHSCQVNAYAQALPPDRNIPMTPTRYKVLDGVYAEFCNNTFDHPSADSASTGIYMSDQILGTLDDYEVVFNFEVILS